MWNLKNNKESSKKNRVEWWLLADGEWGMGYMLLKAHTCNYYINKTT